MSTLYSDAVAKVERDLDLEEENFIQDAEMLEYFNEALRQAEAEVLGIYEDYFLDYTTLALVSGTSTYNLPSGIYAIKIREVVYVSGSNIFPIKQLKGPDRFLQRAMILQANPTNYYCYMIKNNTTYGNQIEMIPAAKETSSNITIAFLRKVDVIADDDDVIDKDIPESIDFVYAYVKARCKQKENGGEMPPDAAAEVQYQKKLFVEVLTNMIPDDDNNVPMDTSFYNESS